ncbi:MAG: Soluble lytic murein transglycosylase [Verrucomicrobiota bacterium]
MYLGIEPAGCSRYTSRPMRKLLPWTVALLGLALVAVWWTTSVQSYREQRFDAIIRQASQRYGVEPALIKAVIWRESRFNAGARGGAGERGLMQIQEMAAIDWSSSQGIVGFEAEHLIDPTTNIMAGTWYLSRLSQRYQSADNPLAYTLADYNAGRSNVRKWIKFPGADTNSATFLEHIEFPSTRHYVGSVLERLEHYRSQPR